MFWTIEPKCCKPKYDCHIKTMKSDILGKTVTVTIDRPLGSHHPVYKKLYYPVNYGYIKGIMAPDGEEQDAYILGWTRPSRCLLERL